MALRVTWKSFPETFFTTSHRENTWSYFIKILPERILTPQAPTGTHTGRMWSIHLSHLIKFTPQSHSNQIQKALQSTTHAVRCLSGWRSSPGKRVYVNAYRGFESLSHRHYFDVTDIKIMAVRDGAETSWFEKFFWKEFWRRRRTKCKIQDVFCQSLPQRISPAIYQSFVTDIKIMAVRSGADPE